MKTPTAEDWQKAYAKLADYVSKITHPSRSNDKGLHREALAKIYCFNPLNRAKLGIDACPACGKVMGDTETNV